MTTREMATYVIARTFKGELLVIDASDNVKETIDAFTCDDNNFLNTDIIPTDKGLYLVTCDIYCDDGESYLGEASDPEWIVTCVTVTELYKI
jgi:hypothetical protein